MSDARPSNLARRDCIDIDVSILLAYNEKGERGEYIYELVSLWVACMCVYVRASACQSLHRRYATANRSPILSSRASFATWCEFGISHAGLSLSCVQNFSNYGYYAGSCIVNGKAVADRTSMRYK